jgi:tetratricopeptide (TPR) repeat protein/tRNA A-37 threonylcarbamoyl transferase component Bud32
VALGRYRIGELIAVGGMGEIYRGRDEVLGKDVAVKALTPARADDERSRHRFVREARYACRVQHPFVCTVLDVVEHREEIFLVLEYIEGRQFDKVLETDHPPPERILDWAIEITEALSAIHKAGLVHRDLKPGNVMITSDGHVKVTDFGVARATRGLAALDSSSGSDATLTEAGHAVGTIAYMSPEQLRGDRVDARSDLFSLGILLWQAVTGEHPFDRGFPMATASAILSEPPGSGAEPDSLTRSGSLRDVVVGLLHKSPADRYESAAVVLHDLRAIARGERVRPLIEMEAVRARRRRIRGIAAALVGVAAVATAAVLLSRRPWETGTLLPVPPRSLIAVLPFELRGMDDSGARGAMLADLVSASVAEPGVVRRTVPDRTAEILAGLPTGASRAQGVERLASMASPAWIVAGSVYRLADGYESSVDLYRDGVHASGSFRGRAPTLVGLADVIASNVLDRIDPTRGAEARKRRAASSTSSDEVALLLTEARQARRELRLGDALRLIEQAVDKDPRDLDTAIEEISILSQSGYGRRCAATGDRVARLSESLGLPPNSRRRLEADAAAAFAKNRMAAWYEIVRTLVARFPDEPALLRSLASAAQTRSHPEEALASLDRALALDPSSPSCLLERAVVNESVQRLGEVAKDIDAAAKIVDESGSEPGKGFVTEARGHFARASGRLEEAAGRYRECADAFSQVRLAGDEARCRANWADMEIRAGRLSAAKSLILPSIGQARANGAQGLAVHWLTNYGAALYLGGQFGDAESTLREAYALSREIENEQLQVPAIVNLAGVVNYTGRFAEGRGLAEEAIALAHAQEDTESESTALFIRCDATFADGRATEALACYDDVLAVLKNQDNLELVRWARLGRAEVAQAEGDFTTSWGELRGVLDEPPVPPPSQLGYALQQKGSLLAALGDWATAGQMLDQADRIANQTGAPLPDLRHRIDLVRASVALFGGDLSHAGSLADSVARGGRETHAQGLLAPALVVRSSILLASGRAARAIESAQDALDTPGLRAIERIRARIASAEASAAARDTARASELAGRALEEAKVGQFNTEIVAAASLIVSPGVETSRETADQARQAGLAAMDAMVRSCPADKTQSFLAHPNVRRWIRALGWTPHDS